MLKLVFNPDGSVYKFQFPRQVIQGSQNTNKIVVALSEGSLEGKTVLAKFKLPNGDYNSLSFNLQNEEFSILDQTYTGVGVYLTQQQTYYAGILLVSIEVLDTAAQTILYTYQTKITVNPSTFNPTAINDAQYDQLWTAYTWLYNNAITTADFDNYYTKEETYSQAEVNGLLEDKADKVGPIPSYSYDNTTYVLDFFTAHPEAVGKVILLNNRYLARFTNFSGTRYYFEIEEVIDADRWVSSSVVDMTGVKISQLLTNTYKANYALEKGLVPHFDISYNDNVLDFITNNNLDRVGFVFKYTTANNEVRWYLARFYKYLNNNPDDYRYNFNIQVFGGGTSCIATSTPESIDPVDLQNKTFADIFALRSLSRSFELEEWRDSTIDSDPSDYHHPSTKAVYDFVRTEISGATVPGASYDTTPTQNSNNLVKSGGIYDAIKSKTIYQHILDAVTEGRMVKIYLLNANNTVINSLSWNTIRTSLGLYVEDTRDSGWHYGIIDYITFNSNFVSIHYHDKDGTEKVCENIYNSWYDTNITELN